MWQFFKAEPDGVLLFSILVNMLTRYKYPRTYHFPWSDSVMGDDHIFTDFDNLIGKEVVVTEKMDGENTNIYPDGMHARSIDSKFHPSRTWVKKLQGEIGWQLRDTERLCGENLYAKHSIHYKALESYFYVFGYWEGTLCHSWDDTVLKASELGLVTVPVLYRGEWNEDLIKTLREDILSSDGTKEGFVMRLSESFEMADFTKSVAKYVRSNHVQTDQHWMFTEVVPNELST